MTLSEALDKISLALGTLVHQLRVENLGGLFSKNRLSEDLFLPIFRIALRAPDLRNVNTEKINFPYIDLADDVSSLAIQITSERRAAKVTETLSNCISAGLHKRYRRLIFLLLTDDRPAYTDKSIAKWKEICRRKLRFNASSDIITLAELFPIIQGLTHENVFAVHDIISRSVIGDAFVDVEKYLSQQSRFQLDLEKKAAKYIPDIFVESQRTKGLARNFTHPVLFCRRTFDSIGRLNIVGCNRLLDKMGLPPLQSIETRGYNEKETLNESTSASLALSKELTDLRNSLGVYENLKYIDPPPFPLKKGRRHVYEESIYSLQQMGWGLRFRLNEILEELSVINARVFILTGKAGQGKTNFICDLVENFLWKHEIPCAYITARRLSAIQLGDLGEAIQRLIFEGRTASFKEAAGLLATHAQRLNKPFVLIIDGLNEHHRLSEFANQLKQFIETFVEFPFLKLFLTCRSEFFQERFGELTKGHLLTYTFLLEAFEHQINHDKERYEALLDGYFKFFKVNTKLISRQVFESLKKDMLLLRFFCEAYGARDKEAGYRQPRIANIYREQIFQLYLKRKLGTADFFLKRISGIADPLVPKANLVAVLEICIKHMLESWQFSDVPGSKIPPNLGDALFALLDEELILRRDTAPQSSIFSNTSENINFTFDELRDFLIAQYLLHRVYKEDQSAFLHYISVKDPKNTPAIEGIKRFLFYASRHHVNEEFWKLYKEQSWYADVYDEEIFNIEANYLRSDDKDVIVKALHAGGKRAQTIAGQLAINWHPDFHPVLNLDLLLTCVISADDKLFDNLIIGTFTRIKHFNDGICSYAIADFIRDSILPKFKAKARNPEDVLFRFLILLLPVDCGADLNSPCFGAFRELLSLYPSYAIGLLKDALLYKPTKHRPQVWRLLSLVYDQLPSGDPVVAQARMERAKSASVDPVLLREVIRFLDCFSATPAGRES